MKKNKINYSVLGYIFINYALFINYKWISIDIITEGKNNWLDWVKKSDGYNNNNNNINDSK